MALMKHRGLFELLEEHGCMLLDTKFQVDNTLYGHSSIKAASQSTRMAITTMLEELAPNLWEDDLNRLVDFGHLISPALEMSIAGLTPGPGDLCCTSYPSLQPFPVSLLQKQLTKVQATSQGLQKDCKSCKNP
ncbi:hypothetical protein AMECASPLE_028821 [Ameca splendens]|uniref:Uncharacterized protein n=1 Tax=Ameca splendens TaxID=208324 RepID=A0ABV0YU56_9TELE